MKYIVELNPAMHLEFFEVEAESPDEAVKKAVADAKTYELDSLRLSHWETIRVALDDTEGENQ